MIDNDQLVTGTGRGTGRGRQQNRDQVAAESESKSEVMVVIGAAGPPLISARIDLSQLNAIVSGDDDCPATPPSTPAVAPAPAPAPEEPSSSSSSCVQRSSSASFRSSNNGRMENGRLPVLSILRPVSKFAKTPNSIQFPSKKKRKGKKRKEK